MEKVDRNYYTYLRIYLLLPLSLSISLRIFTEYYFSNYIYYYVLHIFEALWTKIRVYGENRWKLLHVSSNLSSVSFKLIDLPLNFHGVLFFELYFIIFIILIYYILHIILIYYILHIFEAL